MGFGEPSTPETYFSIRETGSLDSDIHNKLKLSEDTSEILGEDTMEEKRNHLTRCSGVQMGSHFSVWPPTTHSEYQKYVGKGLIALGAAINVCVDSEDRVISVDKKIIY
ncbi:hypothetical protein JTB14_016302 [Gonioctena quinquepunctata]|nr:hypothetical protein JTB14_016302 [Gonioctena quinquepunctata]